MSAVGSAVTTAALAPQRRASAARPPSSKALNLRASAVAFLLLHSTGMITTGARPVTKDVNGGLVGDSLSIDLIPLEQGPAAERVVVRGEIATVD